MSSEIESIARREAGRRATEARYRFPNVDPEDPFNPRADYLRRAGAAPEKTPTIVMTDEDTEMAAQAYLDEIDRGITAHGETVGGNLVSIQAGEALKATKRGDLARTRIILPRSTT